MFYIFQLWHKIISYLTCWFRELLQWWMLWDWGNYPNSQTRGPCRRKAGPFSARMGIRKSKQMSIRSYSVWLLARLRRYATSLLRYMYLHNKNDLFKTAWYFVAGGSDSRVGSSGQCSRWVSQYCVHGSERNSYKLRAVFNLNLKSNTLTEPSKIDYLGIEMKLLRKCDCALSIDQTDAHLHVPMFPIDQTTESFCDMRWGSIVTNSGAYIWVQRQLLGFYKDVEYGSTVLDGARGADHGVHVCLLKIR